MRTVYYLIFIFILLVGCSPKQLQASVNEANETNIEQKEIKQPFDINNLHINYERAFVHDINAMTILADFKNETGYDVKVNEVLELVTTGTDGFRLNHKNSYSMNGEVLKDGETDRVVLLYFKDGTDAANLLTAQPSFAIEVNGEVHYVDGEVMEVE